MGLKSLKGEVGRVRPRRLSVKDLPKDALVEIVELSRMPVSDEMIAGVIIEARLRKAARFIDQHKRAVAEMDASRKAKIRREKKAEAQLKMYNAVTLFESARKLAREYGLTSRYFDGFEATKEAAGGGSPA